MSQFHLPQHRVPRPQPGTSLGPIPTEAAAPLCLAAVVDVDDFVVSRLTRGIEWATDLVTEVGGLLRVEHERTAPTASLFHLEPDEWVFLLHGDDEQRLRELGVELAGNVCLGVATRTMVTVTVSLSGVRDGEYRIERTISEAVAANNHKLVLGGNRVIGADDVAGIATVQLSPARIEQELARRIREGDRDGALELLKGFVTASASLEGVTPEVLRSWIGALILFSLDVAGERRLSDGSIDWVEIFGQTQTSFEELVSIATIHEQSALGVWLEQVLPLSIEREGEPKPKRHILALVQVYLQEHYAEDLSLAKVARTLYVSSFYISHLFHRELNTTFLKYLTAIRMAKARQLLLETDEPIASVAERVGYATPKSFRSVFKKAIGVTPTEFRHSATRAA